MSVTKRVRSLLSSLLSPPPAEQKSSAESLDTLNNVGPNMRHALIRARNRRALPVEEHPGVKIAQAHSERLRNKIAQQ